MSKINCRLETVNHKQALMFATIMAAMTVLLNSEPSHATLLDGLGEGLLEILNNTFLRSLAIAAVILAGILSLTGRIAGTTFLIIFLVIVLMFGSSAVVDFFIAKAASASASMFDPFAQTVYSFIS